MKDEYSSTPGSFPLPLLQHFPKFTDDELVDKLRFSFDGMDCKRVISILQRTLLFFEQYDMSNEHARDYEGKITITSKYWGDYPALEDKAILLSYRIQFLRNLTDELYNSLEIPDDILNPIGRLHWDNLSSNL